MVFNFLVKILNEVPLLEITKTHFRFFKQSFCKIEESFGLADSFAWTFCLFCIQTNISLLEIFRTLLLSLNYYWPKIQIIIFLSILFILQENKKVCSKYCRFGKNYIKPNNDDSGQFCIFMDLVERIPVGDT